MKGSNEDSFDALLGIASMGLTVRAILAFIIGILLLNRPELSVGALSVIIAIYLIIEGGFGLVSLIDGRSAGQNRFWLFLSSASAVIIGIIVLAQPAFAVAFQVTLLMVLLGVALLISGFSNVFLSIFNPEGKQEGRGWLALGGVLSIIIALFLFTAPYEYGVTLVRLFGLFLIVSSVFSLIASYRLRKLATSSSKK